MVRCVRVVIGLSAVQNTIELHHLLMEKLDFPGWNGCNWNAFWDAITGLILMPEILQFKGWLGFALRLPGEAMFMNKCLTDMAKMYPQFASKVVYA